MTNLYRLRKETKQRLREIAAKVGVTVAAVHIAETRGLQTVRAARKYAAAFPGCDWRDLIDDDAPACTCADKK